MSSLAFPFCPNYPRLGAGEVGNLKKPMSRRKKKGHENSVFSRQRTRKGAACQDRKLSDNNFSMPAKHHGINCDPYLYPRQQGQVGSLDFYLHQADWIKKTMTRTINPMVQQYDLYKKTHFKHNNMGRLKENRWKEYHVNNNLKNQEQLKIVSDKVFRAKFTRDKEGHYIMMKDQLTRRYNAPKYVRSKQQSLKIHQSNP